MSPKNLYKFAKKIFFKYASSENISIEQLLQNQDVLLDIFDKMLNHCYHDYNNPLKEKISLVQSEILNSDKNIAIYSADPTKISYDVGKYKNGNPVRIFTTIGRYIKNNTNCGKEFLDEDIKQIANLYQKIASSYKPLNEDSLDILGDENITNEYREFGTKSNSNNLSSSCMTGENAIFTELYSKTNNVKLLTIKNTPVRCLLWTCDDGTKVLDRIYPAQNKHIGLLQNWAIKNGIVYRKNPDQIVRDNIVQLSDNSIKTITIKNIPEVFPYLDTFCFGRFNQNKTLTLSNSNNVGDIEFRRTDGLFDGEDEYSPGLLNCDGGCENKLKKNDIFFTDDNDYIYCRKCFDKLYFYCYGCGSVYDKDERTFHNYRAYCDNCFHNLKKCDYCSKILEEDDHCEILINETGDDLLACDDCFTDEANKCPNCEKNFSYSFDEYNDLCKYCYNQTVRW